MEFTDYNKISDVVLHLGGRSYLKMNVVLSHLGIDNVRRYFHSEVESENGFKINRSFNYFLSIEKSGTEGDFASVMIRAQDMILLQNSFEQMSNEWFKVDGGVFQFKGSKLICLKTRPIIIKGLAGDKYLQFDPIVFQPEDGGAVASGLRITLSEPDKFIDIDIDRFYGLWYSIKSIDLFGLAQNMVNYLGRPEFGTNLYTLENYSISNNLKMPKASSVSSTKRHRTSSKSVFDK